MWTVKRYCLVAFVVMGFVSSLYPKSINFGGGSDTRIKISNGARLNLAQHMLIEDGVLEKGTGSTFVGSGKINLTNSHVESNNATNTKQLNGTLDPSVGNNLSMQGHHIISNTVVSFDEVFVTGTDNLIQGPVRFTQPIVLHDENTVLDLALSTLLTQSIALNNGTLRLQGDLKLADGVNFIGDGTLDLNGYELKFGGIPLDITSSITWKNARSITLAADTNYTTQQNFTGAGAFFQGNGYTANFSGGGSIRVAAGCNVQMVGLTVRGIGSTGNILCIDKTSTFSISNSNIEFNASFTFNTGGIYIGGPTTFITHGNQIFLTSNFSMTVDSNTLEIDTLGKYGGGLYPQAFDNRFLTSSRDGVILNINEQFGHTDSNLTNLNFTSANITFTYDYYLNSNHKMFFHTSATVDGSNYNIYLADNYSPQIVLDPGVTVTFSNMTLFNMAQNSFALAPSSQLYFGSLATIEYDSIATLSMSLNFVGTGAILDVHNKNLDIAPQGSINVYPGANLTMINGHIINVKARNINCRDNTASIKLNDTQWDLISDFFFDTGSFSVTYGEFVISGTAIFNYSTNYGSTIYRESRLVLDDGVTFSYGPRSSQYKNLLIMEDSSSMLEMHGCNFQITATGLQLTNGTLFLDNANYFLLNGTTRSEALIFGNNNVANDLTIEITNAGSMAMQSGILIYQNAGG